MSSDMIEKMREMLEGTGTKITGVGPGGATITIGPGGSSTMTGDVTDLTEGEPEEQAVPPLEDIMARALFSLEEIRLYAMYGRTSECEREATECLEAITAIKTKWEEQNAIMDALSGKTAEVEEEREW